MIDHWSPEKSIAFGKILSEPEEKWEGFKRMTDDLELPTRLHKLAMESSVQVHLEGSARRCWIVYHWKVFDLMKEAYMEGLKNEKQNIQRSNG